MKQAKIIKHTLLLLLLIQGFCFTGFAQQSATVKPDVEKFVKTADIKHISKYFKGYTEIEIADFSGVVNSTKAQMLVKDFFKNKKTGNYSLEKEGEINGSYFIISKFTANGKEQNLYMLFKKEKPEYILQKIEID